MADTEYKRLVQSAKERALVGYLALVQRAMQDADKNIVESLLQAKSGQDQSALTSARHFIRQDGNVFLLRIESLFRNYLDRAMQTMFVDMRPGMRKLSADELSLIDDDVVNHQIEVGRLTERMREANEESVGRLNVIVAQLHGQREARERENPFRPYLLARALYEAIKETAADESKARVLFELLSNALIQHLPAYYAAIREVFESSGVHGKFRLERSRSAHHQRYFGAPTADPALATQFSARLMPGLQHLVDSLRTGQAAAPAGVSASVHEFIRRMFVPSKPLFPVSGEAVAARAAPPNPLVAQLDQYQKAAANADAEKLPDRLSTLRERMDLGKSSVTERMTVDVVALLFEFILEDEQIPSELRRHIARLQVPILKAALIEPRLMQDETHPARRLLNRMSSAAVACDPQAPAGRKLAAEMDRIVQKVLAGFDTDSAIFAAGVQEFERFLAGHLREDDDRAARTIEAVEFAEKFSVLLHNATQSLCGVLLPLNADKGVSDFIIRVWPQVLVRAAWQDMTKRIDPEQADSLFQQYREVLPELLWSINEKSDAAERAVLIRLLPGMVKRLRQALALIQLPEDESKEILDLLVQMHTQILRTPPKAGSQQMQLEDLRQQFARLVIRWDRASWELPEPPQVRSALIEEVFAQRGIVAELKLDTRSAGASQADREFLAQTYLLGTRVEMIAADESGTQAQLAWISTHRSLYLFKREGDAGLALYSYASLLEALRDEAVVPLEYAPVFERAMESLLFGAEKLQASA